MNALAAVPLLAELSLRGWFNPYLAAVLAAAGMLGVGLLYVREAGRLGLLSRVALALLRMGILAGVAFLLLRPVWVVEERKTVFRPVALLVDTSLSMERKDPRPSLADQWRAAVAFGLVSSEKAIPEVPTSADVPSNLPLNPSRIDVARAALENPQLRLLGRLADVGPLSPATFDSKLSGKSDKSFDWIKELRASGTKTAIADSAWALLDRDPNERPTAIVLVTDGRDNAGGRSLDEFARACAKAGVPVHVYGVGSSQFGQVQIRDAAVPDTLFVGDTVSVPVRYRVRGVTAGRATFTLKLRDPRRPGADREVARKEVDAKEGDDLREVLGFLPTKADADRKDLELVTAVSVTSGPETVGDEVSRSVRIVDRKIKVLVVDFFARWDFKFLQRNLLRDNRLECRFFLADADKATMKSGEPWVESFPKTQEELNAYDLLVLGDLPAGFLNKQQREFVRDFVAEGGGLIHQAGRTNAEGTFVTEELTRVLPVEVAAIRFLIDSPERPTPYRPEATAAGIRNPILSLEEDAIDNAKLWRTLPEMYWHYPVVRLRPGAESLLKHPKETTLDSKPMPLMASHYYGKGYVLYLGFDETWRWRFNEAENHFGRFWSQAIYMAGVGRTVGTRFTQLSLNVPEPVLGATGQVYARLFGKDFKPFTAERLAARLERVGGDAGAADASLPVELKALPGVPGEYVATIPFNRTGRFALKVDNAGDTAGLEYRVNLPPEHELAPGGMAEAEMRKLAEETGGRFYREEDLGQLPSSVKPQSYLHASKVETLLWNKWALFALLGLLSAEWTLRKFNSLS